jgi:hypothetical protein
MFLVFQSGGRDDAAQGQGINGNKIDEALKVAEQFAKMNLT